MDELVYIRTPITNDLMDYLLLNYGVIHAPFNVDVNVIEINVINKTWRWCLSFELLYNHTIKYITLEHLKAIDRDNTIDDVLRDK